MIIVPVSEGIAVALAGATAALLLPGVAAPLPATSVRNLAGLPTVHALVAISALALWSRLSTEKLVLTVLLAGSALGVARVLGRVRAARRAEERSDRVLAVCDALASDLAAGQPPLLSLDRAAAEWPEFAAAAAAGHMGADVPEVLRVLAARPGDRRAVEVARDVMIVPVSEGLAVALAGATAALLLPGVVAPLPATSVRNLAGLPTVHALVAISALALWSRLSTEKLVLTVLLAGSALGVARVLGRVRAARRAEERSDRVLAVCDALASDLAAGQPPLLSLDRAAAEWPEFAAAAAAGHMGADVPEVLRVLAARPGARQLRTLAATWQVAHDTGSGLAAAIGQAADAIREERRTARLVASELAAAHATARMLAVLPLGVLLLGSGIGGDPVGFLTGSAPGLGCLALGLALSFAGLLWLERIADRVLGR